MNSKKQFNQVLDLLNSQLEKAKHDLQIAINNRDALQLKLESNNFQQQYHATASIEEMFPKNNQLPISEFIENLKEIEQKINEQYQNDNSISIVIEKNTTEFPISNNGMVGVANDYEIVIMKLETKEKIMENIQSINKQIEYIENLITELNETITLIQHKKSIGILNTYARTGLH